MKLLRQEPTVLRGGDHKNISKIKITAYEPAFGIIGDPAKRTPSTRQSADHSMVYIISTLLRKALEKHDQLDPKDNVEEYWKHLMLTPHDYGADALYDETTRELMGKIEFEHGGEEYDSRYPDGIPTSLVIRTRGRINAK